jgi:hypothetical protein
VEGPAAGFQAAQASPERRYPERALSAVVPGPEQVEDDGMMESLGQLHAPEPTALEPGQLAVGGAGPDRLATVLLHRGRHGRLRARRQAVRGVEGGPDLR